MRAPEAGNQSIFCRFFPLSDENRELVRLFWTDTVDSILKLSISLSYTHQMIFKGIINLYESDY